MKKLMAIVVSALCAAVAFTSFAEVWNIPAPGGVGDVAELERALTSHAKGDEIVLATGTYSLTKTLSNKSEVAVTVRGATGDPKDVVLDGQGQVRCLNLTGKSKYGQSTCFPPNVADRVILKDVTIANGMQRNIADVNCSPAKAEDTVGAGGVYLRYGFVENCVFTNCQARAESMSLNASGGALFARIAFVTNCTFIACEAYSLDKAVRGGAICGISGGSNETYTPADLRFLSCRSVNGSAGKNITGMGGAAYFPFTGDNGTIISKLVFVDCVATNAAGLNNDYHPNGGGLYYDSNPKVTFADCVFSNCVAYGEGGGFWTSKSCVLSNCTFMGNAAINYRGGGLYTKLSVTVENCLFKNNSSMNQGGGISSEAGKLTVRHSCFDKNQVLKGAGGAIYALLGVDAEDCVFRDNAAVNNGGTIIAGGAIYMAANTSEDCLINRCLFQGNTAKYPDQYYFNGGTAIYLNAGTAGGGVFVRNCVCTGNSGASVFAVANCVTSETPTWENGAGFYVQNCTITNNVGTTWQWTDKGSKAIFDGAVAKDSTWKGLFVENCALSGNTDFSDGVFFPNFVKNGCLATQVRNCASDVTTAFPEYGTNGNIAWQKKLKNLGYNSSWITAESTDGGDGTWTEQPVGIYGYYVAANGVNPRCLNEHPAIGAREPRNFGLMLILW